MTGGRRVSLAVVVLVALPILQLAMERVVTLPIGPSRMLTIGLCAVALVPIALAGLRPMVGGALPRAARWMAAVLVPLLALTHLLVVMRFADGPFGPVPGGPFRAEAIPPPADWSAARSLRYAAIEVDPRRPRTLETLVLVHEGDLFVAANLPEHKRWPAALRQSQTARIRLGHEAVYATRAHFVSSADETAALLDAMTEKYGFDVSLGGPIWFFRLEAAQRPSGGRREP